MIASWHVDDLPATMARLRRLGATEYEPIRERGEGFDTAAVVDPFGNVLGVMVNPHWRATADRLGEATGPDLGAE